MNCVVLWAARPQPQALSVSQSMWRRKQSHLLLPMTRWAEVTSAKPIGNRYNAKPSQKTCKTIRRTERNTHFIIVLIVLLEVSKFSIIAQFFAPQMSLLTQHGPLKGLYPGSLVLFKCCCMSKSRSVFLSPRTMWT